MTTPTKKQIVEQAIKRFMQDQEGSLNLDTLPEVNELKEEGYLDNAKMELMSSKTKEAFDNYADDYFSEVDQAKQVLAENDKLREELKKLREKPIQPPQPQPPQTIELSMTVPELHMTVEYVEPEPKPVKVYPIKIQGQKSSKFLKGSKRFLKLSWFGFRWIVKKSAWLSLLLACHIEKALQDR